jgi:hypothetical protein
VDKAVYDFFDKRLSLSVDYGKGRKKASVILAAGERWKLTRDNKNLRDENGTLILPLVSIKRVNIDRTPGSSALAQEVPYIQVKANRHAKTSNMQNLVEQRRTNGFPQPKRNPVDEFLTIPFPDLCTIYYEIIIWTQFQTHMNEMLEKIFYNYDYADSFVLPVEYDGFKRKGNSYYFVGYRDGSVTPQSNVEEFSAEERIIRYSYNIKVPAYLMLDPKDETLAYGRNRNSSKTDDNSKIVVKSQNAVDFELKESVVTLEQMNLLEKERDNFADDADQEDRVKLFQSLFGGGGGGGGTSPTFDTALPQEVGLTSSLGESDRINFSDHAHAHGNKPGGTLHSEVSNLSAGFAPSLAGIPTGYVLTSLGTSASWMPPSSSVASGSISVGGRNLFGSLVIALSNSITLDEPQSSNNNIKFSATLTEALWLGDVSNNKYLRFVSTVGAERIETVSGALQYRQRLTYHSSSQLFFTSSDSSRVISNSGSLIPITASLPLISSVADGWFLSGRVATNQSLVFKASGSDRIQFIGEVTSELKSLYTGSFISIEKQSDGWFVSKFDGEWEIV